MATVKFVIVEGNEGTGKTTLVAKLTQVASFNNTSVLVVRNPGYSVAGEGLRKILFPSNDADVPCNTVQIMLFMSAMRSALDEVERDISICLQTEPDTDVLVILDRWVYTCMVLQGKDAFDDVEYVSEFAFDKLPESYRYPGLTHCPKIVLSTAYDKAVARMNARNQTMSRYDRMSEDDYVDATIRFVELVGEDNHIDTDERTPNEVLEEAVRILTEQGVPAEWFKR